MRITTLALAGLLGLGMTACTSEPKKSETPTKEIPANNLTEVALELERVP